MERIFWVSCPSCSEKFYANYNELRHAGVELMCPFCHRFFLPEDATSLDERTEEPAS